MADRIARTVIAALLVGAVFYMNYRFVLVHFSNGGDLLDAGWFAWIIASGDPWLTNPHAVSDISYFNYHLSPYLSGLSMVFHALGVDGFTALALHQGAAFALLAAGLFALALSNWDGARSILLLLTVALLMLLGDVVLQMASFPHFEIAIPAFCAVGAWLWTCGRRALATLAFGLACLVREDGGLYVAAFLLGLASLRPLSWRTLATSEIRLALAGAAMAVLMFWVKSRFFPGFSTFAYNFSGNGWDHLTPDFVAARLLHFVTDPHAVTALVPAVVLALASRRYLVFPVLMSPLVVAQLLAARDELGHFMAYYAAPFLVIWMGSVLVAGDRIRTGQAKLYEPAVLLTFAILGSGPLLFVVLPPGWLPVATNAIATDTTNLSLLAVETRAALLATPGACASSGVASMAPDAVAPAQVIDPASSLEQCHTVFLFKADLHYEALRPRMEGLVAGPVIDGRVERFDRP